MNSQETQDTKRKTYLRIAPRGMAAVQGLLLGAIAGGILGLLAGWPGVIVGAIFGGVAGTLAATSLASAAEAKAAHTRKLDEEIGVIGGELGAPNLKHPPARIGAFSGASLGVGGASGGHTADGPMSVPGD